MHLQAHVVQGIVYSSDNKPLTGCSVVLFSNSNDSVPVTGTCCNEQGAFSLQAEQGEYRLRASFIGMSPVSRTLLLDSDLTCDTIWMEPDAVLKEEVTVTAQFIEHRADRFIVKIAGNPLAKNTNGMDMLYRIPGTWGLSVYGRSITKVFVNDRELRLPAEQIPSYLRSLDAKDIESYEIIPMAGSEYAGAERSAILRIRLIKAPENGATVTMGLHVNDKAKQKPNLDAFAFVAAMVGKLQSYTILKYQHLFEDINHNRYTYHYLNGEQKEEESYNNHWYNNYTLDQSFTYEFNSKNELSANINFSLTPSEKAIYYSRITENGTQLIEPDSTSEIGFDTYHSYAASIAYRHKWDSIGSYVNASVEYFYRDGLHDYASNYFYPDKTLNTRFSSWTQRIGHAVNPFIDLRIATRHNLSIDAGASYLYTFRTNDAQHAITGEATSYNPNHYNESIYALYGKISGKWNILQYSAGIRIEHSDGLYNFGTDHRKAEYHETVALPSASLYITENAQKNIATSISYSTSIRRPQSYQFDPITIRTGLYSYIEGNDRLKSTYTHSLLLNQSLPHGIGIALSGDWRNNVINFVTRIDDDLLTRRRRFENDGSATYYSLNVNWSKMLTSYWYLNLQLQGQYATEKSKEYGKIESLSASANMLTQFNLPHDWFLGLYFSYRTPYKLLNIYAKAMYDPTVYVTKAFFNQRLVVNLYVYNIGSPHLQLSYKYDKYNRDMYVINPSIRFLFAISYRFNVGKKEVKSSQVRQRGDGSSRIITGLN